jgi:hypothetical protein
VTNQRRDMLHQLFLKLTIENPMVAVEDLWIKCMVINHQLAKVIFDAGWGQFFRFADTPQRSNPLISRQIGDCPDDLEPGWVRIP